MQKRRNQKGITPRTADSSHLSTDVFPTILEACGGNAKDYDLDGVSLLALINGQDESTHDYMFWEMEEQTAVRCGSYKLVLNGRLTENDGVTAPVWLSDLSRDPGETVNLADDLPEIRDRLAAAALKWREGIEKTWKDEFADNYSLTL